MSFIKEKCFRAAIISIPGIGTRHLRQLLAFYGNAENAWAAGPESYAQWEEAGWRHISWLMDFFRAKEKIDPIRLKESQEKEGIFTVIPEEKHYPKLLAECSDAPQLLFYKGVLKPQQEGLAVVGARKATAYGKAAANFLAGEIVKAGYIVVSGLARGIDTAAHKGALAAGGETWAFLAGGLDKIYPPENIPLAKEIIAAGALISEYPPGKPVHPGNFPARNRLISGSSRGVVIVEAAQKSGALITADFALEQGREVFAVPGPIFSEQSQGTHRLLKMGAKLVTEVDDITSEFPQGECAHSYCQNLKFNELQATPNSQESSLELFPQDTGYKEILDCLSDVPIHIDRLALLCSLPVQQLTLGLLELQLADKIIQLPGQHYVLKRL
ncbi:MAG: DNA-protecting protein DprA [Peptococcaceae bacterium]|nr:DNA-protecting protein DprA [Peptococcaceae bacterium]